MALKGIIAIVIVVSIVCVLAQTPVKLDERHLRTSAIDHDQLPGKGWQDSVPGLPGKDYPNLTSIPKTSFSCEGKTAGGYYADVEARCQVFHVCSTQGSKSSFLCPSGSIFNQRHFVCDWWYDFECQQAPELYALNESLDEPEGPTSLEALQFNSLGISQGADLSLASSGYASNRRDHLLYKDYHHLKTDEAGAVSSKEKARDIGSGDNGNIDEAGSSARPPASGIPNGDGTADSSPDNHSPAPQYQSPYNPNGPFDALELNQLQPSYQPGENNGRAGNYELERHSATYLGGPAPTNLDIVPRGFSRNGNGEQARATYPEFERNDRNPGFFINNGLSNGFDESRNEASPNDNSHADYKSKANKNNDNNYDSNYDRRYENYYKNSEINSLPQKINNYSTERNNATSNGQHNNNYATANINDNSQYNNHYENYYNEAERSEINSNGNYELSPQPIHDQNIEASTANPRSFNPTTIDDDVDRERQREVDSVDLKRQPPQQQQQTHRQYDRPAPPFLIRDESSYGTRHAHLPPTSNDHHSAHPPYSEQNLLPSLAPEVTTLGIVNVEEVGQRARERPKFLGRRPAGGLPSGSGNGLPGANKILAGSDSVTGKPGPDSEDSDQLAPPATDATDIWNQNTASGWGGAESPYVPSQLNAEDNTSNSINANNNNDYHELEAYGQQYSNTAAPSWNSDRIFDEQY